MEVYIWRRLDQVTDNYHREGGLVIVASSLARAKELAGENDSFDCCPVIDKDPDHILPTTESEEIIIPFRDAGCC